VSLSPLDDYPIHQVAEPIRRVGTSDRNFYDRYYFNVHSCSGDLFMTFGMGVYPNLGVADAFAAIVHAGKQHVVRASRELGVDRADTTVGPFRIDVLEGLKRLRVMLEPNDWGLDFDLTWQAAIPAHEEPAHFVRQLDRVLIDTCRLSQTGNWSGSLRASGSQFDVTPDRWWGSRDRSWGVRPVGEPEPPGIRGAKPPGTFFWSYAHMQFPDFSLFYMAQENREGRRVIEEVARVWPEEAGRAVEHLGHPEHEIVFEPGTRQVKRATLSMTDPEGGPLEVTVEPLVDVHLGLGTGYGTEPDWRHGMYQGPLEVQGVTFDLHAPDFEPPLFGVTDSVARFEVGPPGRGGEVGYGLWEYLVAGPYDRYGFKGWDDVAPDQGRSEAPADTRG
jgi:hypothetical protein